jgi:hypothetical protein
MPAKPASAAICILVWGNLTKLEVMEKLKIKLPVWHESV